MIGDLAASKAKLEFTVIRPGPAETVSGLCTFAASSEASAANATVEFRIGSKRLGIAKAAHPQVSWNTGYASDGTYSVEAIARNGAGRVIDSAQQLFRIDNHGNSLDVISPDLGKTLSGVVSLSIHGTDRQFYPAVWQVNVDGNLVSQVWTDHLGHNTATVNAKIDTREYSNGPHELYIGMHSDFWPKGNPQKLSFLGYGYRGGFDRVVRFDNGHAPMEIAANYLHVYLQPGHRTTLSCRQLFTDHTSGPCAAPVYSSSDPSEVMVSPAGAVSAARREGFATITMSERGKTTQIHVWVRNNPNVPHFSGGGRMSHSYAPRDSLFVIAPFDLEARWLVSDPKLLAAVKQAGINTISDGFFSNPRKLDYGYQSWRQYYDTFITPRWTFAKTHGLHILAVGDEVCRNIGGEAWWTLNWPSGKAAVQYAMARLAASGVAVGIDMVDEANMNWGGTPRPPGRVGGPRSFTSISCARGRCRVFWPGNPVNSSRFPVGTKFALAGSRNPGLNTPAQQMFNADNITANSFDFTPAGPVEGAFGRRNDPNLEFVWWAGNIGGCPAQPCDPPVPNDALVRITDWLHEAQPHIPISWPPLGQSPAPVQANWMGVSGISDYASHYWVPLRHGHTYTWAQGVAESGYWMTQEFYQRQPLMMLDRPQLMLIGVTGPAYSKKTRATAYYTPPADTLDQPGFSGAAITSSMMSAAALGAAGVRLYFFENLAPVGTRASAPSGSWLQTGVNPAAFDPGVQENWRALASAANALNRLAPYLLGTALDSPAYGRNIVTAARLGARGRMLMIVNDNDWERTLAVDFTHYTYGHSAIRYRISSDGISTSSAAGSLGETITLAAGETTAYVFPLSRSY